MKSLYLQSFLQKFLHLLRRGGAAALADAGLAEKLRAARDEGTAAVLKERSPACGSGEIYDGTFTHTVVDGFGVAAELLAENGIRVLGESELEAFLRE